MMHPIVEHQKPRVLLADDHVMFTEAVRLLVASDCELLDAVNDGVQLVETAFRLKPDVIVTDISMPLMSGMDALREIRRQGDTARVIFLTMHSDVEYVREAFRVGAMGFVLKSSSSRELTEAIRNVHSGSPYLSESLGGSLSLPMIPDTARSIDPSPGLTPRQIEVLKLIAAGCSGKEIAARLDISAKTVEFHKYRVARKLGVHTTAGLTRYAVKHGIIAA